MTGPDVTGMDEYAEKAARDAITESEARAMALQGIVELSRGVDIAVSEIRKGLFMQAAETLLLAKAGCVVTEAAIQKIRTAEARAEERERIAAAPAEVGRMDAYYYTFTRTGVPIIDAILSAVAQAGKSYHHTESWTDDEYAQPSHAARIQAAADHAARIARGEATS